MNIDIRFADRMEKEEVIPLYQAMNWSSAEKPDLLLAALNNSHALVTARVDGRLIGLCNALSDGYLVVYYSNFLVHPAYQGQGIGRAMMEKMHEKYGSFHQQILVSYQEAVGFYRSMGFERAGKTEPMWIYDGNDECQPSSV